MSATGVFSIQVLIDVDDASDETLFEVEAPGAEGYIIGRSDTTSSYAPDIDLTPYKGQELGVSRRHAALVRSRGLVHILDLGSVNGTFINGTRLSSMVAYPLNSGDQLSLANLTVRISKDEE
jgi:pSer/pThr/pTyr-binding forkhead associated (FHA) protein